MNKVRLLQGHALEVLKTIPDESIQCVVTSPPYWGLRDYGIEGQVWPIRTKSGLSQFNLCEQHGHDWDDEIKGKSGSGSLNGSTLGGAPPGEERRPQWSSCFCRLCGAGWVRVVEKTGGRDWRNDTMKPKGIPGELQGEGSYKRGQSMSPLNDTQQSTTLGWQPSCSCGLDPVPQTVLDPFSGAGTTALVAAKLGRDAIGIELNPEYVEMSRKRILGDMGMLVDLEVDAPWPEPSCLPNSS